MLLLLGAFVDVCLLLLLTLWYGCKPQNNSYEGDPVSVVDLDLEFGHFFEQRSGSDQ